METVAVSLTGVQQTLLIPLSARVVESMRADSTFHDPEAERIASHLQADLDFFASEWTVVETVVGRTAILDEAVRTWMVAHPGGHVVNLGAGLCTRFWRVDDGRVWWTDVDLPDVIALKRQVVTGTDRYRSVAGSVLDPAWLDEVRPGPVLFVAEGLLMYLEKGQVQALLTGIRDRFPAGEMWLEAISPLLLRTLGRRSRAITATGATFHWGLREAPELEQLVPGVRVVSVRYPSEVHPERWRWMRILRYIRPIHTALKVVQIRFRPAA